MSEKDPRITHMIEKARAIMSFAYSPYSKFKVGAAVLLDNGAIIKGNNQENAAYPSGLCAERVAIFYANAQYPERTIRAIAIAALTSSGFTEEPIPPCGSCLQVMLESEKKSNSSIQVLLYGQNKITSADSIKQFLPINFTNDMLM